MRLKRYMTAGLLMVSLTWTVHAQYLAKKTVSLELAKRIAAIAEAEAAKLSLTVAISVVDDGGNLVYFEKMDRTQSGSVEVSYQKARSAIMFKRPTKTFEDMVAGGRTVLLALPGALPIEGGHPIVVDGEYVGAIGVSGAKSTEDGVIARAGAEAATK
jgi:glc operon protein GlcG